MSKKGTLQSIFVIPEGSVTIKSEVVSSDSEFSFEGTVGASSTEEVDIVVDKTKIKAIAILSTGDTFTIKTNSTSAPDNTFTVTPTNGLAWSSGDTVACPITVNLTKIYAISGSVGGTIKIIVFYNSSPQSS